VIAGEGQFGRVRAPHDICNVACATGVTPDRAPVATVRKNAVDTCRVPLESFAEMIGGADIPWYLCDTLGAETNYQEGDTGWFLLHHQPSDPARAICRMCRRMCSI
jgi:hypothetical protein